MVGGGGWACIHQGIGTHCRGLRCSACTSERLSIRSLCQCVITQQHTYLFHVLQRVQCAAMGSVCYVQRVHCAAEGSVCYRGFSVLQKGSVCYRGFSVSSLCQCVMTHSCTHTCPMCYRGFCVSRCWHSDSLSAPCVSMWWHSAAHIPVPCATEGSASVDVDTLVLCQLPVSVCDDTQLHAYLSLVLQRIQADSHLGSFSQSECHKYFSAWNVQWVATTS